MNTPTPELLDYSLNFLTCTLLAAVAVGVFLYWWSES